MRVEGSRALEKAIQGVLSNENSHTGLGKQSVARLGHGIKAHGR